MSSEIEVHSCDTFVVLPPFTESNFSIFAKNSDRPNNEIQEIVFVSNENSSAKTERVRCTYIDIDQVEIRYRCVLSKPNWCWGAEMGANEHGLCVGNEAVFSKVSYETREKALTGLDIVRLALERCKTARAAVDLIGSLIENYGQGGECFHPNAKFNFGYDNSFLLVDFDGAWTIETCNRVWVAKQIKNSFYNMSNIYAIADDYDLKSKNLEEFAMENRLWNGEGKLNFAQVFQGPSPCTDARLKAGRRLLENRTKDRHFNVMDMISILRDDQAGICVDDQTRRVKTTSSQVSILRRPSPTSSIDACHFFTGTPNPRQSLFKPFVFVEKIHFGSLTNSGDCECAHSLYREHQDTDWNLFDMRILHQFEKKLIQEMIDRFDSSISDDLTSLFHRSAATEVELLRTRSL